MWVELERAREAERSSLRFLGPWSLCGRGLVKGPWFPSTYSGLPKQKLWDSPLLFPEFLFLCWTLFLPYWTPSFQWCVKCDWKFNYSGLWHCLWFLENGMGTLAPFPLVSCLLTSSVLCAVPRTKLVNDFFPPQEHQVCLHSSLWVSSLTTLYGGKSPNWDVKSLGSAVGSFTILGNIPNFS